MITPPPPRLGSPNQPNLPPQPGINLLRNHLFHFPAINDPNPAPPLQHQPALNHNQNQAINQNAAAIHQPVVVPPPVINQNQAINQNAAAIHQPVVPPPVINQNQVPHTVLANYRESRTMTQGVQTQFRKIAVPPQVLGNPVVEQFVVKADSLGNFLGKSGPPNIVGYNFQVWKNNIKKPRLVVVTQRFLPEHGSLNVKWHSDDTWQLSLEGKIALNTKPNTICMKRELFCTGGKKNSGANCTRVCGEGVVCPPNRCRRHHCAVKIWVSRTLHLTE